MTERTNEEIIEQIKELLETRVAPAVAGHGGEVNFVSYTDGLLKLQMSGACAGCAGSTATLKYGVENMMKHFIPEIQEIEAEDDEITNPYYMNNDPFGQEAWETENIIPIREVRDESDS